MKRKVFIGTWTFLHEWMKNGRTLTENVIKAEMDTIVISDMICNIPIGGHTMRSWKVNSAIKND